MKTIFKCFDQYYQPVYQTLKCLTRFASKNNLTTIKCNKTSQRLIRYIGNKSLGRKISRGWGRQQKKTEK